MAGSARGTEFVPDGGRGASLARQLQLCTPTKDQWKMVRVRLFRLSQYDTRGLQCPHCMLWSLPPTTTSHAARVCHPPSGVHLSRQNSLGLQNIYGTLLSPLVRLPFEPLSLRPDKRGTKQVKRIKTWYEEKKWMSIVGLHDEGLSVARQLQPTFPFASMQLYNALCTATCLKCLYEQSMEINDEYRAFAMKVGNRQQVMRASMASGRLHNQIGDFKKAPTLKSPLPGFVRLRLVSRFCFS